ncbi:UGSC family (seleno)protein [Ilumatobacter sp.]|uniref:UGSC family (seleno)protein n=1 Tax=Ilumatobacter sp. TaxID=1967498 RepID=UPI003C33CB3A
MEPTYDVVWPRSPRGVQRRRRAARLDTLDGKRVAFLWDYLFRGDELFPVLAEQLTDRFEGVEIVGYEEFGNLHGADEKARVGRLPDDLRTRGVDAVVSGMGC